MSAYPVVVENLDSDVGIERLRVGRKPSPVDNLPDQNGVGWDIRVATVAYHRRMTSQLDCYKAVSSVTPAIF